MGAACLMDGSSMTMAHCLRPSVYTPGYSRRRVPLEKTRSHGIAAEATRREGAGALSLAPAC